MKLLKQAGIIVLGIIGTVILTIAGIAISAYVNWHLEH